MLKYELLNLVVFTILNYLIRLIPNKVNSFELSNLDIHSLIICNYELEASNSFMFSELPFSVNGNGVFTLWLTVDHSTTR